MYCNLVSAYIHTYMYLHKKRAKHNALNIINTLNGYCLSNYYSKSRLR